MPDIFDELVPDNATGGDIFDEVAPAEAPISKPRALVNSLVRGLKTAQALPDVAIAVGTANIGKPTIRQERKAYVAAMSDPRYQERLMQAGDDPVRLRRVESTLGPEARLDAVMTPARTFQKLTAQDLAATWADIAAVPQSPAQQRLAAAKTPADKWRVWLKDPIELTAGIVLESLPPSVAGATIGTVVGGPGVGTAAGVGMTSAAMTFSSEFLGAASQQGVDITNPEALEGFLNDPKSFNVAFQTALTKSAIVGGVDATTAGLAGRWIEPALKQGLKERIIASGKELAMQMAGGAGGEAMGQGVSGQPLDLFDVAMEALAEVATAPGEMVGNIMAKRQANPTSAPASQTVKPDIFDEVSSETQPPSPETVSNSRPPAAVATPAPAGASPGDALTQELAGNVVPPSTKRVDDATGKPIEQVVKQVEDLKQVPALTSEQTDAGLNEAPEDDNVPATKADLMVLADFISKGGPNPFSKPSGQPDATVKPAQTITGSNVQTGTEMPVQPKAGAATINPKPVDNSLIVPPAKPQFSVGQKVAVRLSNRSNKEHLARITQLQPDGSAQVQVEGEKTFRMVTKAQLMLTKTDRARLAKQEEIASVPAEQQAQVKADAAEFAQLVEDYAPQLEWAPGEAYDRNTAMQEQGVQNARLRNAAIDLAMRKVLPEGQGNSVIDRARALPLLEAYLKQQFPGDNSIEKRRALEQFGRSEANPQETASVERDQATLDQLAANRPNKPEFRGLKAVGRSVSRGQLPIRERGTRAGVLSSAGASTVTELERIFGVRIIFVENARFNGVRINGTNLVLINAKSPRATLAIAGHELLHHIASTHPGLYADFKRQGADLLKNSAQFRAELARKGYADLTDDVVTEEMFADVMGDAVLDPVFLQQLARAEPNLFKRFARTAVKWLEKLIAKAKALAGFDSAQYVTDLTEMRERLLNLLRDAGQQTQFERAGIQQEATENTEQGQDAFSKRVDKQSGTGVGSLRETASDISRRQQDNPTDRRGDVNRREPVQSRQEQGGFEQDAARALREAQARAANFSNQELIRAIQVTELEVLNTTHERGNSPHPRPRAIARAELEAYQAEFATRKTTHEANYQQMLRTPEWRALQQRSDQNPGSLTPDERTKLAAYWREPGGDKFSMDGDLFGSPESVEEQRARMKAEQSRAESRESKAKMQERAGARLIGKDLDTTREMFGAEIKRDKTGQGDMFSREAGPVWRSNIQGALASWQNKGTPEQLRAHLAKTKGALDEAEWIGLDEWLATTGNSVTKQQVAEFVKANTVDVQEVTKGATGKPVALVRFGDLTGEQKRGVPGSDFLGRNDWVAFVDGEYAGTQEGDLSRADAVAAINQDRGEAGLDNAGSDTKFSQYQLPGGENYRELLLTLPETPGGLPRKFTDAEAKEYETLANYEDTGALDEVAETRLANLKAIRRGKPIATFKSSHFDEPNILAHVRFNERTDADGKKVLFIEEVQSDWHQKGRKEGYAKPPATPEAKAAAERKTTEINTELGRLARQMDRTLGDERAAIEREYNGYLTERDNIRKSVEPSGVPNAPFKQTWPMLAMKRMIRYASENGFDRIDWTTGEQQAERYDLSKQVSEVQYYPDTKELIAYDHSRDAKEVLNKKVEPNQIADYIGKDAADKLLKTAPESPDGFNGKAHILQGNDLKVGGEGMKGFYDKILRSEVNKFVKKWGGRVGQASVATGVGDSLFEGAHRPSPTLITERLAAIRNDWDGPNRTAAGWQYWNVSLDRKADEVLSSVKNGAPYEAAMQKYGTQELATKLGFGGRFIAQDSSARVHSLDITPAMKAAALEGFDMFSLPDPAKPGPPSSDSGAAHWQDLQTQIASAETELMTAIRQHTNPPAGMRKAEARNIRNLATAKLRNLRHDLLRSPDYAEHMILRERQIWQQLKALLEPTGIKPSPDGLVGREDRIREALTDVEVRRVVELDREWEQTRQEIEAMPKKLVGAISNRLYPPKGTTKTDLELPSEWLQSQLGDQSPVTEPTDITTTADRLRDTVASLPDSLRDTWRASGKAVKAAWAKAQTRANRDIVSATKDAADNKAHILSRQAANVVLHEMNRAFGVPIDTRNADREAALTFAIEAGDKGTLELMRETILGSEHARSKWGREAVQAITYAEKHWDRFENVVTLYNRVTNAQAAAEQSSGIKTLTRDGGYVFHLQDVLENWAHLDMTGGTGGAASPFKNIRDYATYADSIANGLNPKTLNAVDLLQRRISLGQKLINYRGWQESLKNIIDPATNQPLGADVIIRVRADGSETETAPVGYKLVRFAGQPYAIHRAYSGLFSALTADSGWRQGAGWHTLMKAATTAKHTMLMFDTFHLGRLAFWSAVTRGAGDGAMTMLPGNPASYRQGLTLLDSTIADLRKMAENGELTAAQAKNLVESKATLMKLLNAGLNVGSVGDNIYSDWVQKLPLVGQFNRWLFEKYQRGAMTEVALIEYQRQRKANPELSDEAVARKVAKAVNIRFGNLNSQAWIKSRHAQDLARLVFLAPQWNESLIRAEIEAVKDVGVFLKNIPKGRLKVGTLGRAVATAFIGQFIANQLINWFFRDKPTWENEEEGFEAKISAYVPDYLGNSKGYFLNPMTLPAEITHLILKGHARSGRWDQALVDAIKSRFSSFGRFADVFVEGKNSVGERATGLGNRIALAAEDSAPLPIGANAPVRMIASKVSGESKEQYPGQFQRQVMQTFGIKPDSVPSPEQRIRRLAREFNTAQGKEDTGEFAKSDYADLDNALRVGNLSKARRELELLLQNHDVEAIRRRYEQRVNGRFTGSAAREPKFVRTLNAEQRKQYDAALAERRRLKMAVEKLIAAVSAKASKPAR